MVRTITNLRKSCIAGCAIALCSLGMHTALQAQEVELVKSLSPQIMPQWSMVKSISEGDAEIPADEKQALIDIYNNLGGASWAPSWNRWDLTASPSTWKGVKIQDGHVVELKIDRRRAKGALPASIANLTELRLFWCQSNQITRLPDELFTMPNLKELVASLQNIGDTRTLVQEFPKKVNLPVLETLFMDSNALTGSLPSDIYMPKVKTLCLQDNKLTGVIPDALTKCTDLEYLYLQQNDLSGELPQDWSSCASMVQFVVEQNPQLEGNFPATLATLTNLLTITIQQTSIGGELPANIGNLENLIDLLLTRSKVGGLIPESIGHLAKFNQLAFGECQFKNPLPASMANLEDLVLLQLTGNPLGGEIPTWLSSLTRIEDLRLAKCQLTGRIPATLFPASKDSEEGLCKLKNFDLSYNQLEGELPKGVMNCPNLVRLWVCHNKLEGNPTGYFTYETFSHLVQIELNDNNFSGGIGELFTNPQRVLSRVDISNNNFSGPILPRPSTSDYGVLLGFNGKSAIVHGNKFVFSDFSNFRGSLAIDADGDKTLVYAPQQLTTEEEIREVTLGKSVTLDATLPAPKNWKEDGDSYIPNSYQWYKNGAPLVNATNPTYTISNYGADDDGEYRCKITNSITPRLELFTGLVTLKQIASVSEVSKPAIQITRAANTLRIEGAQGVTLYSIDGTSIACTEGEVLHIGGLSAGSYMLYIVIDDIPYTVKYIL